MDTESTAELHTALARRQYWRDQYEAARTAGNAAEAERALKRLRLYEWILEWMEDSDERPASS